MSVLRNLESKLAGLVEGTFSRAFKSEVRPVEIAQELAGYLLEHARREKIALMTSPKISFRTDERLRLGEFGIQARLVKPAGREHEPPSQGDEGHTQGYSASARLSEPLREPHPP